MATGRRYDPIPLAVMEEDGTLYIIQIPRMSASAFEFFKTLLETYKRAIVIPEKAADGGGGE